MRSHKCRMTLVLKDPILVLVFFIFLAFLYFSVTFSVIVFFWLDLPGFLPDTEMKQEVWLLRT